MVEIAVDGVHFNRLSGHDITARDIKYLQTVTGSKYNPFDGGTLVEDAFAGRTEIWRATEIQVMPRRELCYFLMALEVRCGSGPRLLEIVGIAGKGYFRRAETILPVVKQLAKAHDCAGISGRTTSRGLRKLYEAFGAKEDYRYHVLEVL
tara:strand:+ start:13558 stop:14007 length:450 start_codon:yes stop_codon:yes gene_type:complete